MDLSDAGCLDLVQTFGRVRYDAWFSGSVPDRIRYWKPEEGEEKGRNPQLKKERSLVSFYECMVNYFSNTCVQRDHHFS